MEKQYRVMLFMDDTYQVINTIDNSTAFQGSLSDCNAWLQLNDKGYI